MATRAFTRLVPASRLPSPFVNGSAGAQSGAGQGMLSVPACYSLVRRLGGMSKSIPKAELKPKSITNTELKPKSIPKVEPKKSIPKVVPQKSITKAEPKSIHKAERKKTTSNGEPRTKPETAVETLILSDEFGVWPTRSVHFRRLGLSTAIALISFHFLTARDEFFDDISDMQYKIKVQEAKKQLLKNKLTGRTL